MNFELTEDQEMLADSAKAFARKESPVTRLRAMRKDPVSWEKKMWKRFGEQGWLGILYPESLGGYGGTMVDMMLILEAMGTYLVPEPIIDSAVLGGLPLLFAGSKAQQEKYLKPMIAGDTSLALAVNERENRYSPELTAMSAKKQGAGFVLSGEKVFVPNGQGADHILVLARTAGKVGDQDGLSLFIVPKDAQGLKIQTVNGMDSRKYGLLKFDGAQVGADQLVGEEGKAFPVVERVLDYGAAAACCEGVGIVQEMLQMTVGYLNTRKQFGVLIGTFQGLQHRAVDMFVESELCKSSAILAAIKVESENAEERKAAISAAKAQLSLGGKFVSQQATQLHGGIGVTDEHDISLYFKRMHILNVFCGDERHHVDRFAALPGFAG
jgi:alkylation response protein AidB-like acyl-CoA dehydrogenase